MNSATAKGLIALVQDAFAVAQIPGGSTTGYVLQRMLKRRVETASEILITELRRGEKTLCDVDEDDGAAVLYRYLRAAQEGTARLNLRLMAKVIAGQAEKGNLVADVFLYYADVLASLRREEIVLLGAFYRNTLTIKDAQIAEDAKPQSALFVTMRELVPAPFPTDADFVATAGALTRTGLLASVSLTSGITHVVTPLLERLYELAPLEAAINEEVNAASLEPTQDFAG